MINRYICLYQICKNLILTLYLHPNAWSITRIVATEDNIEGIDIVTAQLCKVVKVASLDSISLDHRSERDCVVKEVEEEICQHLYIIVEAEDYKQQLNHRLVHMRTRNFITQETAKHIQQLI